MIPLNQKVKVIFTNKEIDEWGIPVKSDVVKHYKVRIDFNSAARIVHSNDEFRYLFSANIYFKGRVPIDYTDLIEYDSGIDGIKSVHPHQIHPIADLAGNIIYTKVII